MPATRALCCAIGRSLKRALPAPRRSLATFLARSISIFSISATCEPRPLHSHDLIRDLPSHTYDTPAQAVASARALIEAGAQAVKLEGGVSHIPQIEAIVAEGIPFIGHIGMLPQSVREEGGYKVKGRTQSEAEALVRDGLAVEKAGAFAVVLEIVSPEAARQITRALEIPTTGIGSAA